MQLRRRIYRLGQVTMLDGIANIFFVVTEFGLLASSISRTRTMCRRVPMPKVARPFALAVPGLQVAS